MAELFASCAAMIYIVNGGSNILMEIATHENLHPFVYVVYCRLINFFVLAPFAFVIDRLEKLKLRSLRGQAKVVGTVMCIIGGGSLILTFWKGLAQGLTIFSYLLECMVDYSSLLGAFLIILGLYLVL